MRTMDGDEEFEAVAGQKPPALQMFETTIFAMQRPVQVLVLASGCAATHDDVGVHACVPTADKEKLTGLRALSVQVLLNVSAAVFSFRFVTAFLQTALEVHAEHDHIAPGWAGARCPAPCWRNPTRMCTASLLCHCSP